MSNEMMELTDAQAVQFGFAPTSTEPTTPVAAEATNVTPAVESQAVTATPVEQKTDSEAPKTDAPPAEVAKPLYTPEEVAQILKEEAATGKVLLDSSRLTPEGKLLQKSFQQGYGPKFEDAKRIKEEAAKMRADAERQIAEFQKLQREAEEKKRFDKEAEELGEEEAKRLATDRRREERIAQLEWENQQAKDRESSLRIREDYRQVSPKFNVPQEQIYEDAILAQIVAGDFLRVNNGKPPRTIEESAAQFADAFGFTNVDNLWKIIRANPENEAAVKNFYINNYVKEKAKGPTVSASTTANVQVPKPPANSIDPNKSTIEEVLGHFGVSKLSEINLT